MLRLLGLDLLGLRVELYCEIGELEARGLISRLDGEIAALSGTGAE